MYNDGEVIDEAFPPTILVTDEMIRRDLLDDTDRAWTSENVKRVRARREAMSGLLFFDTLLRLGGIENAQNIFPPSNKKEYSILLDAIFATSYDNMKRDCLIYYLLKFLMNTSEVRFASQQMLAHHYASLADAYWFLDNGFNLDNAITHLSDVRIIKEYSSKIMETLSLDAEADRLIRRFVRTCSPSLKDSMDMTRYMLALAEHSVVEAWEYQQLYPNNFPAKKELIRNLLSWVLSPKPKQEALKLLLTMQMTRYEEATVRDFAERPPEELPAQSASIVRDMVCVRLIQQCRYVDAIKFDRMYPSPGSAPRATWGTERERIIKEIIAVLPAVERRLLETELESMGGNAPPTTASSGSSWTHVGPAASSSTADLSASWEDIGRRLPRRSIGRPITGRTPRTSLANGASGIESSNSGLRSQPLSAYPTLVSSSNSAPLMSTVSSQPTLPIPSSISGPAKVSANGHVNGKPNGAPKTNAFMSRNAFYEPPERSSSPENANMSRSPPKQRAFEKSVSRLPTPPLDEPERPEVVSRDESDAQSVDNIVDVDENDRSSMSDQENLSYSIFGNKSTSAQPTRLKSPPLLLPVSPPRPTRRTSRLYPSVNEIIEVEAREKSPQISFPGAFVHDDEEKEHDLASSTSATNPRRPLSTSTRIRRRSNVSANAAPAPTPRRSTRKRAASPAESVDEEMQHVRISIPGALLEDDDEVYIDSEPPAAHTRAHMRGSNANANASRRAGTATWSDDEEESDGRGEEGDDSIAPLPSHRTRRKAGSGVSSASPMKPTRGGGRGSRAGSLEPELGGSLRRSTRLTHASVSPVDEAAGSQTERKASGSVRPRKSTRTSGAGATATGKGAAKRR